MIRFLFRCLSTVALAAAVLLGVLDATRTIAASTLVMTPLGASWQAALPGSLASTRDFVEQDVHPLLWQGLDTTVLATPGFAVFLVLALAFFLVGRRPEPRIGRPSFRALKPF